MNRRRRKPMYRAAVRWSALESARPADAVVRIPLQYTRPVFSHDGRVECAANSGLFLGRGYQTESDVGKDERLFYRIPNAPDERHHHSADRTDIIQSLCATNCIAINGGL
jgi:hypothetical protein